MQTQAYGGQTETGQDRPLLSAIWKGWRKRCPSCGEGKLFQGFSRVQDKCAVCCEDLSHQRADDAPPYFTIFIVGHLIIPALLLLEKVGQPAMWIHLAIWLPLSLFLCLYLLPKVKGAVVGLQWSRYMHGFGGHED